MHPLRKSVHYMSYRFCTFHRNAETGNPNYLWSQRCVGKLVIRYSMSTAFVKVANDRFVLQKKRGRRLSFIRSTTYNQAADKMLVASATALAHFAVHIFVKQAQFGEVFTCAISSLAGW